MYISWVLVDRLARNRHRLKALPYDDRTQNREKETKKNSAYYGMNKSSQRVDVECNVSLFVAGGLENE